MSTQEKTIGKSSMLEQPSEGLPLKLKNGAVTTSKLANQAVTLSKMAADPNIFTEDDSKITLKEEALRNILKMNCSSDAWDHSGDDSIATSGLIRDKLSYKQNNIQDLSTIRSGAAEGSISIQNIRNLMAACNEVFRIGFIGYHIEMSAQPDVHGDYTFSIVMNE